ncbi:MAG: hypothetical protein K5873_07235 [Treponema sp.]|nr:hypothetical protein [Treponema sp.]
MDRGLSRYCILFSIFLAFSFTSCGELENSSEEDAGDSLISLRSVTNNAQSISMLSGGLFCQVGKDIVFSGSLQNKKISSLTAQLKYSSDCDFIDIGKCSISGNEWTVNLNFEKEGLAFIRFKSPSPSDSEKSVYSETGALFIVSDDISSPVWTISTPESDKSCSLKNLEELKSLDLALPENKDVPQNQDFIIKLNSRNLLSNSSCYIQISDEKGRKLCDVWNSASTSENYIYSVKASMLTDAKESLLSGRHYLQVNYVIDDFFVKGDWFIWYPESDLPQIYSRGSSLINKKESLELSVNTSFSLTFFDDKELEKIYSVLLTEEEYNYFKDTSWDLIKENPSLLVSAVIGPDSSKRAKSYPSKIAEREVTLDFTTASEAGTMTLLSCLWDDNNNFNYKEIKIHVIDENTPSLVISSPEDNTISSITMSHDNSSAIISISGLLIDSKGCSSLQFSWNDKVWNASLSESQDSSTFKKQDFTLNLDLLKDFNDDFYTDKNFSIKALRSDGSGQDFSYTLKADTSLPLIKMISPAESSTSIPVERDYNLEFMALKDNGLALDETRFCLYRTDLNPVKQINKGEQGYLIQGYDEESKIYRVKITKELLKHFLTQGENPSYSLTVYDIFGNHTQKEVQLSPNGIPQLLGISSAVTENLKEGDEIEFQAVFSSEIDFDDSLNPENLPYLKLKGITNILKGIGPDNLVKATYKGGASTKCLVFTYTVQKGDCSDGLLVFNEKDSGPIDIMNIKELYANKVNLTSLSDENNLQSKKNITIDGILPSVSSIELSSPELLRAGKNSGFIKNGQSLTVKVRADKSLLVSGKPYFLLYTENDEGLKSEIQLPFVSLSNKILTFSKKLTESDGNGNLFYISSSCIKNSKFITDTAGNSLVLDASADSVETPFVIDTIAPEITAMSPSTESEKGSNIYREGNIIKITFSEAVKKGEGKIYLRQPQVWPLPSVLTEDEFNSIMALLSEEDKEILSRQEGGFPMKDAESIFNPKSTNRYPNDTYHGNGHYLGPYIPTNQGALVSEKDQIFIPDMNKKYVLDFDIGIWETDEDHYYDRTFENGFASQRKYENRGLFTSITNPTVFKILNPSEAKKKEARRTADQIRKVLEKVNCHQRIIDLSSVNALLSEDGLAMTLNFPKGILDQSDSLPDGREWQLIIERGAILDEAGNLWEEENENIEITVENENGKKSFFSDKVAKPVIRTDRYSYGLGIYQSNEKGEKSNQITADLTTVRQKTFHDDIKPTAYIRARIDCPTKGTVINYSILDSLNSELLSNITEFENTVSVNEKEENSPVFAAGNGDFKKACSQIILAQAQKEGFIQSEIGNEIVLQTLVHFIPKEKVSAALDNVGLKDLSISGKVLDSEYETFSPLHFQENGSPYLRRCYRNEDGWYWLSYEVLSDTEYSYYNWTGSYYDWSKDSYLMKAGQLSDCHID